MTFLVFSDLHLNKFPYSNITKEGNNELLMSGLSIIDQVCEYAIKNKVDRIFFLGDFFHVRYKLDSEIYSNLLYDKLHKYFSCGDSPHLVVIPGNHDQIDKKGRHILRPFSAIKNVHVIDELVAYGDNFIFCPHQYDIEKLYDFLSTNSNDESIVLMHQLILNSPSMNCSIFRKNEAVDVSRFTYRSIFSGHNHRPFMNEDKMIFNVGSPMHYDFGDAECPDRYFIHFDDSVIRWIKTDFPHFAIAGAGNEHTATYVRRLDKKVKELSNRVEISFDTDMSEILKTYIESSNTTKLDKSLLLAIGTDLLRSEVVSKT